MFNLSRVSILIGFVAMLAVVGFACGEKDVALWSSERAKAAVANYIYSDALEGWEKQMASSNPIVANRASREMPDKLTTGDWVAEYHLKGQWRVDGSNIGVWFAFEDGSLPVQRVEPRLELGEAHIQQQLSVFGYLRMVDCGLGGASRRLVSNTPVEIVEIARECDPPLIRVEGLLFQGAFWVLRTSVRQ